MKIDLQELKRRLKPKDIINIMSSLGANKYEEREEYIIFPTICHNPIEYEASMKLYYYKESYSFHCYTECGDSFDIFDLIKKVKEVNKESFNFYDVVCRIADFVNFDVFSDNISSYKYESKAEIFNQDQSIELKKYNKKVLENFKFFPTAEWLNEGISERAHKKFNILYYNYQNKIVIPHYDYEGNLIGIRGRALEEREAELYGKYTPLKVENIMYKHPLSFNLYGLYENQENIKEFKTAIIFEGEL